MRTEAAHELEVLGAADSGDVGAEVDEELDGGELSAEDGMAGAWDSGDCSREDWPA